MLDRGHLVTSVGTNSVDQVILAKDETTGALILTADRWFLSELFRYPVGHRQCYQRAGVILLPGTGPRSRVRLVCYLPDIELQNVIRSGQPDRPEAIHLSQREIRIREP
jgi:hypothetical protein